MTAGRRGAACTGFLLILALGIMLAGCTNRTAGDARRGGEAAGPPLVFDLGRLEIVDETPAEPASPDLAAEFPLTPAQALRNWAALRLRSQDGRPGILRFYMTAAEAERAPLLGTPGIRGWFTRDQAERVSITLAGRLEARRNDGSLIASANARAKTNRTFAEDAKPAERRAGLDELLATTVAAFDREVEERVKADMADVLN